jgi:hypothetical protein
MTDWEDTSNWIGPGWARFTSDGALRLTVWEGGYPSGWAYVVHNENEDIAIGTGFRTAEDARVAADAKVGESPPQRSIASVRRQSEREPG